VIRVVNLLTVTDLGVTFTAQSGRETRAVDGVSLTLRPGETVGLVGESGSGKSVTSHAISGLLPDRGVDVRGSIRFGGHELVNARESVLRSVRGNGIACIFQDPLSSLNPVLTVGTHLTDVLTRNGGVSRGDARRQAVDLLQRVQIPDAAARTHAYPHQLSGGMRQRVAIAMALACEPRLLIADEPTTALDVTVQAQVLTLIRDLVRDTQTALLLITHDLGIVAGMCERAYVMYSGRVVESAPCLSLFGSTRHHYTRGLLDSMPDLDAPREIPLRLIEGSSRDALPWAVGCAFAPRCRRADDHCGQVPPMLEAAAPDSAHAFRCHYPLTEHGQPVLSAVGPA
jgi:peptide/nickel transport system ATP-binding protein